MDQEKIIEQTKKWIVDVVVGCNFCPFAAREVNDNTIHYEVSAATMVKDCLETLLMECRRLDVNAKIETTIIILPAGFQKFGDYLDLIALGEKLFKQEKYEGVYQLASFHPDYKFSGAPANDAANYTNRSPYPMLHILREESIEKALANFPNPDSIPDRNVDFARKKGLAYMKMLRDSCL